MTVWVIGESLSRKVTFKLILERQEGTTVCSSERASQAEGTDSAKIPGGDQLMGWDRVSLEEQVRELGLWHTWVDARSFLFYILHVFL